jgi:ABC-type Fe3+/spermidine/putrescine transport system ATPase subunit
MSPAARVQEVETSSPVWVTIRPHCVVVKGSAVAPTPNCFEGRVDAVEFLGSRRRCIIGLGAENCTVELYDTRLREGSTVVLEFPEQHLGLILREP